MIRRLCLCAPLAAVALALAPAGAAGAVNHPFLSAINGGYEDACGLALHGGGLYVADHYHDAVDLPTGKIAGVDPADGPCGLALDSEGNLYVNNWRGDVVEFEAAEVARFESGELSTGSGTEIDPGPARGAAVGPNGDLYVDRGTYIARYAAPVHAGETAVKIGLDGSASYYGVAVSGFGPTEGDLYVADAATETVKVYNASGTPLVTIDGAATPQAGFHYLGESALAVDPADGHLFVADEIGHNRSEHPEAVIDEFNPAGEYRGQIAAGIIDSEPPGIAVDESTGNVEVTSGNSEGSSVFVFGPTAPAHTLTAKKTGIGAGTVSSQPVGINCGGACAAEFNEEETITLFATPDSHSAFTGWSVTGAEPCPGTGSCTALLGANVEVSAEFERLPQKTLSVSLAGQGKVTSKPAGIACPGSCSEEFNEGATVTLAAAPEPHNRLAAWGGACSGTLAAEPCKVTMSEAKAVHAEFEPIPPQTLKVNAGGEGTVTSSPAGIACTVASCEAQFDEGAAVTLTATPAPHSELSAWSGCEAQPAPNLCEVTMGSARSVGASFAPIRHSVSVSVNGEGSVSADSGVISSCTAAGGDCSGSYLDGETVTLTAIPSPGWAFAGFSGGCGGSGPCRITLGSNLAVTANFAPIPPVEEEILPARLTLGKLAVKGATAALKLSVSGPGTVSATGKGLKGASAAPTAEGPLSLHLALDAAGRRALRKARNHKLKVEVTLTLTPTDGAPAATVTKAVSFKAKGGRGHHRRR